MRNRAAIERRAQLGKLPLQPVEHRLSCRHGLRQRGLLASLRLAADARGQPPALCGPSRAYATSPASALGAKAGALAAFFGVNRIHFF